MSYRGGPWLGVAASIALHLGLAVVLVRLPAPAVTGAELALEIEITTSSDAQAGPTSEATGRSAATRPAELEHGGRRSAQNIDARDRGQGGEARGASAVILLFHQADAITLTDSPLNTLGPMQTQRIATARDRATGDARRATPNPGDEPFLASGSGSHPERRPVSAEDARSGARVAPDASRRGSDVASLVRGATVSDQGRLAVTRARNRPSDAATGAATDSPGVGIADGRGERATEAARVAHGRPPVDLGPAATPAETVGRVRDDEDAELLAARLVHSMVESTQRRGREGPGTGGAGGGGRPGSGGGHFEGGRASVHGPGSSPFSSLDTSDGRYVRWLLEQRNRVGDRLRFPRERMLRMDQGTTVCMVSVRRDGSFAEPPSMVRSSGHGDLDEAALSAIRDAAPFTPIPRGLAPDVDVLTVTMPIRFHNPMVGN